MTSKSKEFSLDYVESYFSGSIENKAYIDFHKFRYLYLLNLVQELVTEIDKEEIQILDIGPMFQTNLIRDSISNVRVHTMGENYDINHLRQGEVHIELDLNFPESYHEEKFNKHDIILFSEVIEHLYTKPQIVLNFLKGFLAQKGFIIIQTPNAVAIHKRLKMIIGIHPFDQIDIKRRGHFREYTITELVNIITDCGLEVYSKNYKNYFNNSSTFFHRAFVKYQFLIPPFLRDGITIIARNN